MPLLTTAAKSLFPIITNIFRIYVISDSLPIAKASRAVVEIETFIKPGKILCLKKEFFAQILFARNKNPL